MEYWLINILETLWSYYPAHTLILKTNDYDIINEQAIEPKDLSITDEEANKFEEVNLTTCFILFSSKKSWFNHLDSE